MGSEARSTHAPAAVASGLRRSTPLALGSLDCQPAEGVPGGSVGAVAVVTIVLTPVFDRHFSVWGPLAGVGGRPSTVPPILKL